jgi:6,7-dimethyl-8-ribityllumazine synthase
MFKNNNQPKIAVITSKFNEEVTQLLYQGAIKRFEEKDVSIAEHDRIFVPGAIEIPVVASQLAATKQYDAIVCLGAVIQGETDHYDYVCWQVSYGCQKIAVEHRIPVIFGILTTDTEEQAFARCGGAHGHKGVDCADAALEMIAVMKKCEKVAHGFVANFSTEVMGNL